MGEWGYGVSTPEVSGIPRLVNLAYGLLRSHTTKLEGRQALRQMDGMNDSKDVPLVTSDFVEASS
jgi:hypothetical protein